MLVPFILLSYDSGISTDDLYPLSSRKTIHIVGLYFVVSSHHSPIHESGAHWPLIAYAYAYVSLETQDAEICRSAPNYPNIEANKPVNLSSLVFPQFLHPLPERYRGRLQLW